MGKKEGGEQGFVKADCNSSHTQGHSSERPSRERGGKGGEGSWTAGTVKGPVVYVS